MVKSIEEIMDFVRQYPCSAGGCSVRGLQLCEWCKKQAKLLKEYYGDSELIDTLPKKKVEWKEF